MEEAINLFFVVPDCFRTGTTSYNVTEDRIQPAIKKDCPAIRAAQPWKGLSGVEPSTETLQWQLEYESLVNSNRSWMLLILFCVQD